MAKEGEAGRYVPLASEAIRVPTLVTMFVVDNIMDGSIHRASVQRTPSYERRGIQIG
jgi:hypothetical protein